MLKRFAFFAAALVVAFSLSLSSFAADAVQLGFPYFGRVRFSKGSSVLYTGSNGEDPITGIRHEVTDSSSGASYLVFDLYPYGTFSKTFQSGNQSISYQIPNYTINNDVSSSSGMYVDALIGDSDAHSSNTYGTNYWNSYHFENGVIDLVQTDTVTYTATISSGSNSVSIQNNIISGGDYVIFGQVEYPYGSVSDVNNVFTGTGNLRVQSGNHFVDINDIQFHDISLSSNYNDIVQFAVSFTVPYSMQFSSIRLQLNTKSSFTSQIQAFAISSGGFEYSDDVNSVAGLSSELAGWFSGLKSGISSGFQKISSLISKRDDDAAQAEASADHEAVSEAQSKIQSIESFESNLNSSIQSSLDDIDFTVPSSYGSALNAVVYVFSGIFSDLGGYQVVITIPLILGIMLILIGRGALALGRMASNNTPSGAPAFSVRSGHGTPRSGFTRNGRRR